MSEIFATPDIPISSASSVRNSSITRATPSRPNDAIPHKYGRAIPTAAAPMASAFKISVPRRNPPSTNTGILPSAAWTHSSSASIVEPGVIELPRAVIRHDYGRRADLNSLRYILADHQPLQNDGQISDIAQLPDDIPSRRRKRTRGIITCLPIKITRVCE